MRTRRGDARRNRRTILQVAEEAFSDSSDVVPLNEIARRTGLGRATVYRHFPDRHALAGAVVAEYFGALKEAVDATMNGRRAFRDLLQWVLETGVSMRPLVTLMGELPPNAQQQYTTELIAVLSPPFHLAQAQGQLREDVRPTDLAWIMAMLTAATDMDAAGASTAEAVGGDRSAAIERLLNVLLDGLFIASQPAIDQTAE
ncbi:TetR/AcrR family transcriptional regulator [Frankia sp. AgB1.9]|uniref:TetR/AcrR family transcriptional regulator n=1 Tax=unclassified Frankia TaxID=2632575 RepID=UPI0019347AA4|nr:MULTISPECIES: TetR/AcrR family transcriptional regulator [unclassified Frankia]MBL7493063.1 TetR/AcrR family transcriptional regulator [Frankia sp. AgW1.1]MBL7547706.1 TetR/AcrR family transcriptional regulator [Frankia sp. AgB1.9]MBL7622652.1 TetR/AcrR family transcriptional regulator [Frankia sp. AgB1.8]